MLDSLIKVSMIFLVTMLISILIISAMDINFNNTENITYLLSFKMNALNALFSFIMLIIISIVVFNSTTPGGDTSKGVLAVVITFVFMYVIKSALINNYGLDLSSHFLLTVGGLLVLSLPYALAYLIFTDSLRGSFFH